MLRPDADLVPGHGTPGIRSIPASGPKCNRGMFSRSPAFALSMRAIAHASRRCNEGRVSSLVRPDRFKVRCIDRCLLHSRMRTRSAIHWCQDVRVSPRSRTRAPQLYRRDGSGSRDGFGQNAHSANAAARCAASAIRPCLLSCCSTSDACGSRVFEG